MCADADLQPLVPSPCICTRGAYIIHPYGWRLGQNVSVLQMEGVYKLGPPKKVVVFKNKHNKFLQKESVWARYKYIGSAYLDWRLDVMWQGEKEGQYDKKDLTPPTNPLCTMKVHCPLLEMCGQRWALTCCLCSFGSRDLWRAAWARWRSAVFV